MSLTRRILLRRTSVILKRAAPAVFGSASDSEAATGRVLRKSRLSITAFPGETRSVFVRRGRRHLHLQEGGLGIAAEIHQRRLGALHVVPGPRPRFREEDRVFLREGDVELVGPDLLPALGQLLRR